MDQLCAGLQSGIERAIHFMTEMFEAHQSLPSGWGVLLIDASNAFNLLNWIAMLLNIHKLWPCCSHFVINTYCGWPVLVLHGHDEFLYSKESVTDPLPMFVYVVATLPLVHYLRDANRSKGMWMTPQLVVCLGICMTGLLSFVPMGQHLAIFLSLLSALL